MIRCDFKITKIFLFLIILLLSIYFFSCGETSDTLDTANIEPYEELGKVGEKDIAGEWVARIDKGGKELYPKSQFIADADVMILSNMNPNEVSLKIDNPTIRNNFVWEIISAKLLYREALNKFLMLTEDYKSKTIELLKEEAKGQYYILREINLPIKKYEPDTSDKMEFYNDKKEIFEAMGIKSYSDIIDFETDYISHYIKKVNEENIKYLERKYDYELNENIIKKIKSMYDIKEVLESDYKESLILTINNNEIIVKDFAVYLLMKLTMLEAKSMLIEEINISNNLEMEVDTIIQNFLRHHLLLEEFKTKEKNYNENELNRFINLYVESRIADVYIRKEIDNRIPPPLANEVDEFYEKREVSVKNFFWKHYADTGLNMDDEEREDYISNIVAQMVLKNENIKKEQKIFRNYILKDYNYKINNEVIKEDILNRPYKKIKAENPLKIMKRFKK